MVGQGRLELPTSPLSGVRSNQLSYRPVSIACAQAAIICRLFTRGHVRCVRSLSDNECEYSFGQRSFKEVIQPQVPLRLPCYDFTPVIDHTVDGAPLAVRLPASGAVNSHGVTGGVYKARERIHRDMLIRDY